MLGSGARQGGDRFGWNSRSADLGEESRTPNRSSDGRHPTGWGLYRGALSRSARPEESLPVRRRVCHRPRTTPWRHRSFPGDIGGRKAESAKRSLYSGRVPRAWRAVYQLAGVDEARTMGVVTTVEVHRSLVLEIPIP